MQTSQILQNDALSPKIKHSSVPRVDGEINQWWI